ncbi:MAG: DUF1761 domain-containing protein [Bacteroidota bacterium]
MNTIMNCWWQVLLAGTLYFVLGAIWYSPISLGSSWAKGHGIQIDPEARKNVNMGNLFALSFMCGLLLSALVCWVCAASCGNVCNTNPTNMLMHCLKSGWAIGLGAFASMSMSFIYLQKPINVYLIDGGYHLVGCTVAALVYYFTGCYC